MRPVFNARARGTPVVGNSSWKIEDSVGPGSLYLAPLAKVQRVRLSGPSSWVQFEGLEAIFGKVSLALTRLKLNQASCHRRAVVTGNVKRKLLPKFTRQLMRCWETLPPPSNGLLRNDCKWASYGGRACTLGLSPSSHTKFFSAQCHSSELGSKRHSLSLRSSLLLSGLIPSSPGGALAQMAATKQSARALALRPPPTFPCNCGVVQSCQVDARAERACG